MAKKIYAQKILSHEFYTMMLIVLISTLLFLSELGVTDRIALGIFITAIVAFAAWGLFAKSNITVGDNYIEVTSVMNGTFASLKAKAYTNKDIDEYSFKPTGPVGFLFNNSHSLVLRIKKKNKKNYMFFKHRFRI